MADPTSTQISDLRLDFGDASSAFSDAEITRLWTRIAADSPDSDNAQYYATLALMFMQAMNSATKFHDYTVASDQQKLSQVYDHYRKQYELYKPWLDRVVDARRQVSLGMLRAVKRQSRDTP